MEKQQNPSSWICSQKVREQSYHILSSTITKDMSLVTEYDREKTKLIHRSVNVDAKRPDLSLHSLYEQSEELRLRVFYSALGVTTDVGVVSPANRTRRDNDILTSIIIHWINHSQPQCCKMYDYDLLCYSLAVVTL